MKRILIIILSLLFIFSVGCSSINDNNSFDDGNGNKGESVIEPPVSEESSENDDESKDEDSSKEEPPQKEENDWTFIY